MHTKANKRVESPIGMDSTLKVFRPYRHKNRPLCQHTKQFGEKRLCAQDQGKKVLEVLSVNPCKDRISETKEPTF